MVRTVLVCVFFVLLVPATTKAQDRTLSGTVLDQSAAIVPGATVTLTGPVRETAVTGVNGEYRFSHLVTGTYQVSVALQGFSPVTRDVVVGNIDVEVPPITLTPASVAETLVVTASKSESHLINAPATMTVIGPDVLESTPAQNFGDLLRSVPGLNVSQLSARDINLTSRQATSTLADTQLALLDGRSMYLDFFGLVLWDLAPVDLSNIKQIEVVRGPASAIWGANALTGVVNIITKSPREAPGTTVNFSSGAIDRDAGSTIGQGAGAIFGANVTTSQIVDNRWSYRISAGYFDADRYPRPTGRIPLITDPRDPTGRTTVGGAAYPIDGPGPFGSAFQNRNTKQPRFDARVDQELSDAHITYEGGVAGTSGTIYTGIGPFDIQPGSVLGFGRMSYTRGSLKFNAFTNILNGQAPNLLLADPLTGQPIQLNFKTQTYDVEFGDQHVIHGRHSVSYGGNYRRNNFDITIAPAAQNRNEVGGYVQDDVAIDRFRFSIGGRVDKFGNIANPVFSPRLAAIFQPKPDHSLRVSFNRAFRSPSVVNNYLDTSLITPVDLSALAPFLPPPLRPAVANPFPLVVHAVGSELPIGAIPQAKLEPDALTAWEFAYTGTVLRDTLVGAAFYINDSNRQINFVTLPPTLDPYTAAAPPPGWTLPPAVLTSMAQLGIFLPRTGFTYLNLGPTRQKGLELSVDHRFNNALTSFANYSWQADPVILSDPNPYPTIKLALPPTNRFNVGGAYNGPRFIGNLTVNHAGQAFWSDVLTPAYYGYTNAYTMTNGTFGVKWRGGKLVTSVKSTNLFNQTIQQHVFGDLLRRSVIGEVRFQL
jgi:outer membrane receptor protein involved in Fe transport